MITAGCVVAENEFVHFIQIDAVPNGIGFIIAVHDFDIPVRRVSVGKCEFGGFPGIQITVQTVRSPGIRTGTADVNAENVVISVVVDDEILAAGKNVTDETDAEGED